MPEVEIDEAELLRLRRLDTALGTILKHPAARKKLAAATKDVNPNDPLAKEADIVDPIEARFAEMTEANAKLAKQIEDDKAARDRDAKLGALKSEQEQGFALLRRDKWTDDGIEKVRKVMEEKGILDVAIAAKWVESQMPPQNPVMPGGSGGWNFMDMPAAADGADADLKKLIESKGQNEPLVTKMAWDAIHEVRGTPGTRR